MLFGEQHRVEGVIWGATSRGGMLFGEQPRGEECYLGSNLEGRIVIWGAT